MRQASSYGARPVTGSCSASPRHRGECATTCASSQRAAFRRRRDDPRVGLRAVAVHPGVPNSMHLGELPMPRLDEIPGGRGVLVKVLRVGVDGTDREINEGLYGKAPPGSDFLITGHENFGQVVEAGPNVSKTLRPGAYVVATLRRPGSSPYDKIGRQDPTPHHVYYERGINLRHAHLVEYYVEDAPYVVPLPPSLRRVRLR